jgi:hypothetical protein
MKWMFRQIFSGPVQHLVVDDGNTPITIPTGSPPWLNITYLRRLPSADPCTLQDNLLAAIPLVKSDKITFFEDDEHYSPRWLQIVSDALDKAELIGEMQARCYNVRDRGWYVNNSRRHASLCRTGIRASLLPKFAELLKLSKQAGHPFVDLFLWGVRNGPSPASSIALMPASGNSIGIKGLPGRAGLGRGHREPSYPNVDPTLETLRSWIGADADEYARFFRAEVDTRPVSG